MKKFSLLILSAIIVIIDQIIKSFVVINLKPIHSVGFIKGLLNFTYVENYGAAYGIFTNQKWFLIVLTSILLCALLYVILAKKISSNVINVCCAMILGGGIGNLIDRIRLGFVVDYIDITPLFSFPVFNFADCFITVAEVIFIIYILFFDNKKGSIKNAE